MHWHSSAHFLPAMQTPELELLLGQCFLVGNSAIANWSIMQARALFSSLSQQAHQFVNGRVLYSSPWFQV
jgi:hypothetical protein